MMLSENQKVLILTSATYFCLGVSVAAIGPVLPELARNTHSGLAAVGAVFTAIFLGALLAQLTTGPISDRFGQKVMLVIGVSAGGVGMLLFTLAPSLWMVLLCTFLGGIGHGAADLSGGILVARVFSKRSVAAMNLLNFFYGLGAFIGPALVGLALSTLKSGMLVPGINAVAFLVLVPFILTLKVPPMPVHDSNTPKPRLGVYRAPLVWMLGMLLLIYVGIENGLGGWIATYMTQTTPLSLETSALVSAGFWLALTFGRLVNAYLGMRLSPARILYLCIGSSAAGSLVFAASTGNSLLTILAVLLTGFGFGAIYPTVMAIVNTTFYRSPGKAASLVAALGSGGGMLIPWFQGLLLEHYGPPLSAWFVAALAAVMLLIFFFSQNKSMQPPKTPVEVAG
jgi:fucose permease